MADVYREGSTASSTPSAPPSNHRYPACPQYLYLCVHMHINGSVHKHGKTIRRCEKENGMETRRGAERTMAGERSLQLPAAVAEAGMALRLRQGARLRRRHWLRIRERPRIRVRGSPIQPMGMPEVPVAPTLVVGPTRSLRVRRPLRWLHRLRLPTLALPELCSAIPHVLVED